MERRLENFCLTPAVDGAFQQVMKTGALQGALGNAFTLAGASAHDDRIDLTIHDASAQSYSVVLALQSIASRRADGREGPFLFYLDPTTNGHAEVTAALLGAASVLARAIPDSALSPCGQRTEGDARAARYLVTAGVEVQIIVLAVVIGLRALRQPIDPH